MAGRGYDDEAAIRAVEAILAGEPGTSRRAAIIRVAGENGLRRIEMKMSRRGAEAQGSLRLPSAGMERDPLAVRLAAGEGALVTGAGERRVWSGLNSRDAILGRLLDERVPAYRRAERALVRLDRLTFWGVAGVMPAWCALMAVAMGALVAGRSPEPFLYPVAAATVAALSALLALLLQNTLCGWIEGRTAPVREEVRGMLRRYVVTDRALYVLKPEPDGVSWTRTEFGALLRAEAPGGGNVRLFGSAGETFLTDVADGRGLIDALAA